MPQIRFRVQGAREGLCGSPLSLVRSRYIRWELALGWPVRPVSRRDQPFSCLCAIEIGNVMKRV